MSSWLPFKIPENIDIDISKRMETVKEKATMGVASLKEGAAVVSAAAEAGMQRASVGAAAGAAAVTAAAGATADKFKSQAQLVQCAQYACSAAPQPLQIELDSLARVPAHTPFNQAV